MLIWFGTGQFEVSQNAVVCIIAIECVCLCVCAGSYNAYIWHILSISNNNIHVCIICVLIRMYAHARHTYVHRLTSKWLCLNYIHTTLEWRRDGGCVTHSVSWSTSISTRLSNSYFSLLKETLCLLIGLWAITADSQVFRPTCGC